MSKKNQRVSRISFNLATDLSERLPTDTDLSDAPRSWAGAVDSCLKSAESQYMAHRRGNDSISLVLWNMTRLYGI